VLSAAGLDADIVDCARESSLQVVPRVLSAAEEIATIGLQSTATAGLRAPARPSLTGTTPGRADLAAVPGPRGARTS
jgi:hypothetical protein